MRYNIESNYLIFITSDGKRESYEIFKWTHKIIVYKAYFMKWQKKLLAEVTSGLQLYQIYNANNGSLISKLKLS